MAHEITCKQCGTPVSTSASSIASVLCDDICLGAWLDRMPGGHFRDHSRYGTSLCTPENPCDLHERLALKENPE